METICQLSLSPKVDLLPPSLCDAKKYIYSLDFSMIIKKMVWQGWSIKVVNALAHEYKNFLFLNKKYLNLINNPLPPSEEIDIFWHNHILDTIKYKYDCKMIFGYYFDHYPYFGMDDSSNDNDLNNAFENMLQLYLKEFGSEMPKITTRLTNISNGIRSIIRKKSNFNKTF